MMKNLFFLFPSHTSDLKSMINLYSRLNIIMPPVTSSTTKKTTTTTTSKTSSTGKTSGGVLKKGKKKIAAAPLKAKAEAKKLVNPLYEKRAKNFGIGQGNKISIKVIPFYINFF
jgi:hypothetical protein